MAQGSRNRAKYYAVVEKLKGRIMAGEFCPGDQIPTLESLCATYGVSHITARHAVDVLEQEGLLYRVQGSGTFVAEQSVPARTIALVLPHLAQEPERARLEHSFTLPLIHAVEEAARAQQANIMLYLDNDDLARERENLRNILHRQLDGAIVFYIGEETNLDALQQLQASGIPLVLVDRYPQNWSGSAVITDHYSGARHLVSELIARGFTRVYHITTTEHTSSTANLVAGYLSAMRGAGLTTDGLLRQLAGRFLAEDLTAMAYALAQRILAESAPPYAFFTVNAEVLLGICQALHEATVDLHEVGLACLDNAGIALPPALSVVQATQQFAEIGRQSVQLVMDQVHGIHTPRRVTVPAQFQFAPTEVPVPG